MSRDSEMTIKPCVKCGTSERYTSGRCKPCTRDTQAKYRAANTSKIRASNAKYSAVNAAVIRVRKAKYHAANADKIRARHVKRYAATADKVLARQSAYHAANPDKRRIAQAKHYAANSSKVLARHAEYRAENHDKIRAANAAYRVANPEKLRIHDNNRRARERGNGGELSHGLAVRLFKLQKGKCPCCNKPLGNDYHLDHIMPIKLGGKNEDLNMQLLRQRCNQQKSARHPVAFMQSRGFLL